MKNGREEAQKAQTCFPEMLLRCWAFCASSRLSALLANGVSFCFAVAACLGLWLLPLALGGCLLRGMK